MVDSGVHYIAAMRTIARTAGVHFNTALWMQMDAITFARGGATSTCMKRLACGHTTQNNKRPKQPPKRLPKIYLILGLV